MSSHLLSRRAFARFAGAVGALLGVPSLIAIVTRRAGASAPLTKEALAAALGAYGIESGGMVRIAGNSYRLDRVHVNQVGEAFNVSFIARAQ